MLLYDGSCGLCDRTVRFVLRRDRKQTLRFASLQSPVARNLLEPRPALAGTDSMVWIEPSGAAHIRSAAAIRVARYLGGIWNTAAVLLALIPRPLRDAGYDLIARHRHRLSRPHRCFVPAATDRHRFLDGPGS